ncbi:MAG: tetratricopeptide repeat protein [Holophagaceae bacterium]
MRCRGSEGQGALLRRAALALCLALLPTLLAAASVTVPAAPASVPAVALSHRARQLMGAVARGDAEAIRSAQLDVEILRRTYSTLDVAPLVEAMALWSSKQGIEGHPEVGLEGLQAVERWAPDHPTLLGARIALTRQQGLRGWVWSVPDLIRLTRIRMDHPSHRWLWLAQHLGMLRLGATLLLWGWALVLGLRYRHILRDLWEAPLRRRGAPPALAAILGALLLAGPVLLGLDPMVAAILWLFLLGPVLLPVEVKATVLVLCLQLIHPALVALEPWTETEPGPSLQALQLQPQVLPGSVRNLSRLPALDQAFLAGWGQLQHQDWKAASATFQALADHQPGQPEVLNNLGVARFQSGDLAGAERAFEQALAAAPRMEILLNQSILAFNRLDTAAGSAKREQAQALAPSAYALLISLNDARRDPRTYPIPLPDTPERLEALGGGPARAGATPALPLMEPAFLAALLLPGLGLLLFLARVKGSIRVAHATQCVRCGEPFHTTDSPDPATCPKCHHLFVLRDGLHAENRRRKLDQVAAYQRTTRWVHRSLVLLLPGCDLAFLGETRAALVEFMPFCLAAGMVLAMGRTVRYPGEILPDPISTWLLVGLALLAVFYLRSWLKLVMRRA